MKKIISYDLGTGGTKASLFDRTGESLASAFISCETFYPGAGLHEQRPEDWWNSVRLSTRLLLEKSGADPEDIEGLAVSGHSLGAVPIGQNGELLAVSVPIWSDARAREQADRFFSQIEEEEWYRTTGNGFSPPLYSIFKIMWFQEHNPEQYAATRKFIGTKDYINYKMTGVLATDRSYASGSGVYSLQEEAYVDRYITASGVDADKLPPIYASTDILGTILPDVAAELGLSSRTKVCAGGVDNACMALGAVCMENGDSYTSLGSSGWIAVSMDHPIINLRKRPYVFAHCIPGQYVSATSIFSAGNSFRWLKNVLFEDAEREDLYTVMDDLAAQSPAGAHGLIFVPTLAGGSGLDDSPYAKGCYAGLELRHTRADLIRAALEGICFHLRMALHVLEENTAVSENMLLVGGGGKSPFWRQLFADIYEKNILETNVGQDAGSLGAAAVAAVGTGLWEDFSELRHVCRLRNCLHPRPEEREIYRKIYPVFEKIAEMQSSIGEMLHEI